MRALEKGMGWVSGHKQALMDWRSPHVSCSAYIAIANSVVRTLNWADQFSKQVLTSYRNDTNSCILKFSIFAT
jgi:hypothetical protein